MSDGVKPPELSAEDLDDATFDCLDGYEVVEQSRGSSGRWQTLHKYVIRRKSDNTFWLVERYLGNTEYQENEDAKLIKQVFRKEKTVVTYE